jgi:hypothetical protein
MYSNDAMIAHSSQSTNSWSRKGVGRMDKYNCGTCAKQNDCPLFSWETKGDKQFSTLPQHMHPCEHGQPVVATAIAAVEFADDAYGDGDTCAFHKCIDDCSNVAAMTPGKEWTTYPGENYCQMCGLRLPTAEQLPAMYEAWKKEQEGKDGQSNGD